MPRGGRCSVRCTSRVMNAPKTVPAQTSATPTPTPVQGQPESQHSTSYQPQLLKQTVALVRSLDWNTLKWPAGISGSQTFKSWWKGSDSADSKSIDVNDEIEAHFD